MDDENVGYFHSGNQIFPSTTDLLETLEKMDEKIGEKIAQWTSEKSDWTSKAIVKFQVNITNDRWKGNSTLAVNVYRIDDSELYPLHISNVGEQRERELNLLLIKGYMCLNHVYSKEVLETNKECCVNHKAAKIRAAQRRDIPADFCQQHPPDESPFRSVRGL
ncbi:unnamed protein product [Mytilus edulis]|uniref:Uncharacterized protein n=1 Tax=Mytilus edulis TaxID=6550 RepID=A0A8S3T4Y4_MYTED|nr:unnamed protein product [Mytilus edulis]